MNGEIRMNKERYSDPTAEQAIAHVMKECREKKKQEGSGPDGKRKIRILADTGRFTETGRMGERRPHR